jgi:cell fate regulator YaaT (PSP1 superfamily)
MSVFQVRVEFHRLEALVPFWLETEQDPSGPVVAPTPRGEQLGWIRQWQPCAGKAFPLCRPASPQDLRLAQQRKLFAAEAQAFASRQLEGLQLDLRLEGAHQVLDGNLLVLYFSADERVDFRPLVKAVAQQYGKKIELYQLNPRQRSQNHGAQGRCGRECCCISWLREFPSVSVKMAEEQGFQLQPEAITGVCGRFLCCLRYEYESYLEQRQHPQPGDWVDTPEGLAQVLEVDPHTNTLLVNISQHGRARIPIGRAKKKDQCQSCQEGTAGPLL